MMDHLPDEILLQILEYLDLHTITTFQRISKRFVHLARDSGFWKGRCYDESKFESRRRRQLLLSSQDPNLVALRTAMTASSLGFFSPDIPEVEIARDENVRRRASDILHNPKHSERMRALASWDPSYPGEEVDFYQDYIQRHARSYVDWLEADSNGAISEAIGVGAIPTVDTSVRNLVTAQEDGSIRVWDLSISGGRIAGESKPGTLSTNISRDTERGEIDNLSVDSRQGKAYIAVSDDLHEIDLNTLQVARKQVFPFSITALSEARHPTPLTVGTNQTIHLFDPRKPLTPSTEQIATRLELIGGTPPKHTFSLHPLSPSLSSFITLEQPGPTSILHLPSSSTSTSHDPFPSTTDNDTIIIAGRFTSLLTYSRRFWPKTTSTLFSGARLSSATFLPYPYIPRTLTQSLASDPSTSLSALDAAKAAPGFTLIAAGEYNGKGSLELYGLPRAQSKSAGVNEYRNRQTASKTRLISVATHGTSIVFSDGDGNMKWVERDGSTVVREMSVSVPLARSHGSNSRRDYTTSQNGAGEATVVLEEEEEDDIVQKILPIRLSTSSSAWPDDLVIRTSEGKVGVLAFGRRPLRWLDGDEEKTGGGESGEGEGGETMEEKAEREARMKREGEERRFGRMMREALERQADEVRWVRRLGF